MEALEKKILVPVNFSDQSLIALEQTYNLVTLTGSEIILLYVNKLSSSIWSIFSKDEQESFTNKINAKLCLFADELRTKKNLKVRPLIRKGKVHEEILKAAKEEKADFIVLGTTHSDNILDKVVGNTAFRVVREAPCPVITVKGKHHRNVCDHIILPIDLTKETREKVSHAIRFARIFKSTVHVVAVITSTNEAQVRKQNGQLKQVVDFINRAEVACSAELLKVSEGQVCKALLEHAHKKMGDLVIIMTQQENDFVEYFVGSTASEVIFHSDIPIMSIVPTFKHHYKVVL